MTPPIRALLAPNPSAMTGPGTNTYLIGQDYVAVVDPGPNVDDHISAILSQTGSGLIRAIFVTHRHADHVPAALPLSKRTGAPIYGHADLPGVMLALGDGEAVEIGGIHLRALATPGHTPEHHCYLVEELETVFCGDLMAGSGTVIVGSGEGELAAYLSSLRRLLALAPARILPGHGPPIEDPKAKIQEYLDHRQLREGQLLATLSSGPRTSGELRAEIYEDLPAELESAAENNVRAHLLKLRAEGRVRELAGAWTRCSQHSRRL